MDKDLPASAKAGFPLLALALAACASDPIDPSEESAFLQDRLIPHMIEWGKTKSDVLPLGPILASQGFEKICTVAEYQSLSVIQDEVPEIRSYRGSVGDMVPETRIAIIGIRDNTAHVGYLRYSIMYLRNKKPLCTKTQRAVLRRLAGENSPRTIPDALLEEAL